MRVTFNMLSLKYLNNLGNSLEKVTIANDKVTKGRNLINPENDVVFYASSINVQRTIDEGQQFSRNAENAISWLSNYDNELQRAFDIIRNAKSEYAVAGANDSQNATSRKALAGDVANMLKSLIDVGNANYFGRYFFAGYKTDTKPFAADSRAISAVKINGNVNGADVIKRDVFADLPELKEGSYSVSVISMGDYAEISLKNANGENVIIDSNGSDESAKNGNFAGTSIKIKYKPGEVVNLGVGVAVKLPEVNSSFNATFYYKPGDDINYFGDDGQITTKIGYQQDVTINFTGKEVFTEVERILKGTRFNTIKGLAITETTKFSEIQDANVSLADSIEISGTDHNGLKIGTAKITGVDNVDLNFTKYNSAQRTLSIVYANRNYSVTLDSRSYTDLNDVIFSINRELESQGLGEEIKAVMDGDKIMLATTRAGNAVKLKITASDGNPFGMAIGSIEASGKDTTFDFGYDNFSDSLSVSFTSVVTTSAITVNLDNHQISIPASAGRTLTDVTNQLNNQLPSDIKFLYNFKVDGGNLVAEKLNMNFSNNTILTVRLDDGTNNVYKSATPRNNGYPYAPEKNISDLLKFIEDLYDNTVDAKLNNGYLEVADKRGGTSRLSIKLIPSNSGIGYPEVDQNVVLQGRYNGGLDDDWYISTFTAPGTITVKDKNGITIKDITIDPSTYKGEPIDLGYGVNIILPDISIPSSFKVSLKASSSLSFGDMNIVQEGKNVNTFRSLKNLYNALNLNIPKEGIGAPSAWRDENFISTLKPYLGGTFRGNYNDEWKYEVLSQDQKTSFYLQKELTTSTKNTIDATTQASFDILVKGADNSMTRVTFSNVNISNIVNVINTDTTLANLGVKAELVDNRLVLRSGSGLQEIEINPSDSASATALGLQQNIVYSKTTPNLNLANSTDLQRTLQFSYYDGTNWNNADITVQKRDYTSLDDLISEINNKITALTPTPSIVAQNLDNQLVFNYTGLNNMIVSGDHQGTLGFFKKGDEIKIKITNSKGDLVNELKFDTANQTKFVADGVKLSFDAGTAYATDSFTSTVGSGINYEIGILDKAENQINEKLTMAGTRKNRADAVVNFQATVKTVAEDIKSKYLGSRGEDATKAITEFQLAQQAYQAALATASKIMQLSILDYIR
jgi:flagellin-like hook-associated protein FlgL